MKNTAKYLVVVSAVLSGSTYATAETLRVLDSGNHPSSAEHREIFAGDVLPLDATLSWRNRFNGDETFNASIALPAHRSNSMVVMDESPTAPLNKKMDGQGIVKGIRLEQGKVKIQHSAIEKYGMPAMTMFFRVRNPTDLAVLKKGMTVQFDIDNSSGGFEITQILPAHRSNSMVVMDESPTAPLNKKMDGQGVVKGIRLEQGKVKIQHSAIEKYGMPAMTMFFRVRNPTDLAVLKKGMTVQFDIDNSSGGFEITQIKPVEQ